MLSSLILTVTITPTKLQRALLLFGILLDVPPLTSSFSPPTLLMVINKHIIFMILNVSCCFNKLVVF